MPPTPQTLSNAELASAHGGISWIAGPKNVIPKRLLPPGENLTHMVNHMAKSFHINASAIPRLLIRLEEQLGPSLTSKVRSTLNDLHEATVDSASHTNRSIYRSNDL